MTRVLITGANGHLGANLVRSLLGRGYEVVPFVRRTSDLRGLNGLGLDYVFGDVMDYGSLLAAAEGCDVMIHTAAVYRYWAKDRDEILQPALVGTRNALTAAKETGIQRVIYTSSTVAVGFSKNTNHLRTAADWNEEARNPYTIAKTQSEKEAQQLADELGLAMISLCPCGIIGPYDYRITPSMAILQGYLNGTLPVAKAGASFVDVRDVAEVHARAVEVGEAGERYIVAGQNVLLQEYGQIIERLSGVTPRRLPGGRAALLVVATLAELASSFTKSEPLLTRSLAQEVGDRYMYCDCDSTYRTFNLTPKGPEEMIRDGIRWLLHIGEIKPAIAARISEQFPPDPAWEAQKGREL